MMYFTPLKTAVILGLCLLGAILCIPNLFPAPAAWLPWRQVHLGLDLRGGVLPAAGGGHEGGGQGAAGQHGRRACARRCGRARSSTRRWRRSPTRTASCCSCAIATKTDAAVAAIRPLIAAEGPTGTPEFDDGVQPGRHDHADAVAGRAERARAAARCSSRSRSSAAASTRPAWSIRRSPSRATRRIVVQLPGISDPNRIKELLGKTAHMTFQLVDETANANAGAPPPPGVRLPADAGQPEPEDRGAPARGRRWRRPDRRARRHQPADRRVGGQLHLQLRRRAALRRHHPRQRQPPLRHRAGRQGDQRAGDPRADHRRARSDQRQLHRRHAPTTWPCCCAPARCRRR